MFRIVLSYNFTEKWIGYSWEKRNKIQSEVIAPIMSRYVDHIDAEFVDAEAFDHDVTDFVILKTDNLIQYYYFIEEIRESELIRDGLLKIRRIQVGIHDGFRSFEHNVLNKEKP